MKNYIKILLMVAVTGLVCQTSRAQDSVGKDDVDSASMSSSGDEVASTAQSYGIRPGDTMWDICKIVLDNPWYWPKLWSLNQYILNPNLIFPGNQLVFSPATDTSYPRFDVVTGEEVEGGEVTSDAPTSTIEKVSENSNSNIIIEQSMTQRGESLSVKLRSISFITKKELRAVGKVSQSVEPKMQLVFGDKVYLKFFNKQDVKLGDKFRVIERVKVVFDPDRETKKIGMLIKKKAMIVVSHIFDNKQWQKRVVEATIADGDDTVLREDEIIPYESDIKSVIPHYSDKEIYGKIVEADSEQFLISNNDFVFLNIGTKDGIQPGTQLYVVRQGDGLFPDADKDLPDVPVAKILVVDTHEKNATAYVTTLDRPLAVGDRVRSKVE